MTHDVRTRRALLLQSWTLPGRVLQLRAGRRSMTSIKAFIASKLMETDDQGAIGYIVAWLLGVPAVVLFAIFLLRGCT